MIKFALYNMKTMKHFAEIISKILPVLAIALSAASSSFAADNDSLYRKYSGNLMAYPYTDVEPPAQTPVPEGYTPFHIEHYGRHGSRWLIGHNDYATPVERLTRAERAGKLTPLGRKTLEALRGIEVASERREGELSDKGAVQHRVIGRRMARNFPEIFTDGANVDAKATVVIRCILSMLNGLEGICEVAPGVKVHSDASYADMYFMNYDDKPAWKVKDVADSIYRRPYQQAQALSGDYLLRLVNDEKFARDSVAPGIMPYLYWVLANTQSHTGQPWLLPEVFSEDEVLKAWRYDNAGWVMHSINSPMSKGRMPYTQRKLLTNMIESTDSAMMSAVPGANLRYGHDGILINLITLMELNGLGREFESIEQAEAAGLRSYELIPMAGNMQMIIYKPTDPKADWLVKVLLNEREVTLPVEPVTGPYYSWQALRKYYLDKLAAFKED